MQRDALRLAKEKLLTLWEPNAGYAQTAAGAAAVKAADIIRTLRGECLVWHCALLLAASGRARHDEQRNCTYAHESRGSCHHSR